MDYVTCSLFSFRSSLRGTLALACLCIEDGPYSVAFLELQKLFLAFVLVDPIKILCYTASKHRTLRLSVMEYTRDCIPRLFTSAEHLATASANFSIGLVLPGIFDRSIQSKKKVKEGKWKAVSMFDVLDIKGTSSPRIGSTG